MMIRCPFCKELHDLGFEEKTLTEKYDGETFDFIETTIKCKKLDLKKTERKLKDPARKERLLYVGTKAAYNELPDGLKEKFKKEVLGR